MGKVLVLFYRLCWRHFTHDLAVANGFFEQFLSGDEGKLC
jgi:hypothetical protein